MPGPWDQFKQPGQAAPAPAAPAGPWQQFAEPPAAAPEREPYRGNILPLERGEDGKLSFAVPRLVQGAAESARDAFTYPGRVMQGETDPSVAENLNFVTWATPANPAFRAGNRAIPGPAGRTARPKNVATPGYKDLLDEYPKAWDQIEQLGVEYSAGAVDRAFRDLADELMNGGVWQANAPGTYRIIEKLTNPPANATAPISGMVAARRALQKIRGRGDPNDGFAAGEAIRVLDDIIGQASPSVVVAGPGDRAARLLFDANANYAAGKQSQRLTNIRGASERGARTHGTDVSKRLRSAAAWILDERFPKRTAGLRQNEVDLIAAVADGKGGANALRAVERVLTNRGLLPSYMTGAGAGSAVGYVAGPIAGGATALGVVAAEKGARAGQNRIARQAWDAVDEAVRSRAPAAQRALQQAPTSYPTAMPALAPRSVAGGVLRDYTDQPEPEQQPAAANPFYDFQTWEEYLQYLKAGGA